MTNQSAKKIQPKIPNTETQKSGQLPALQDKDKEN